MNPRLRNLRFALSRSCLAAFGLSLAASACTYRPVVAADETETPTPVATRSSQRINAPFVSAGIVDSRFIWDLTSSSLEVSKDGGAHWSSITPPNVAAGWRLKGAMFVNQDRVFLAATEVVDPHAINHLVVYRSDTGGRSWRSATINLPSPFAGDNYGAASFSFASDTNGWLSVDLGSHAGFASGWVYRTTDAGITWSAGTSVAAAGPIRFLDTSTGFAIGGAGGVMYGTIDGGRHWSQMFRTRKQGLNYVLPVEADGVWILPIWYEGTGGEIGISLNHGMSWRSVPNSIHALAKASPLAASIISSTHWIVPSVNGLLVTVDAGNHWNQFTPTGLVADVYSLSFASGTVGIAVAGNEPKHLELTTDGGHTWKIIRTYPS